MVFLKTNSSAVVGSPMTWFRRFDPGSEVFHFLMLFLNPVFFVDGAALHQIIFKPLNGPLAELYHSFTIISALGDSSLLLSFDTTPKGCSYFNISPIPISYNTAGVLLF